MSMLKVFFTGVASGALLAGAAFGAAWYAAREPKCLLARALDGACHATAHLSPVNSLSPLADRLDTLNSLAKDETDLGAGLPDEPMPEGAAAPGTALLSNKGDAPPPVVIPEDMPESVNPFPEAPVTPGGPPPMPRAEDGETSKTLHMPRMLEEEQEEPEQPRGWFQELTEKLAGFFSTPSVGGEEEEEEPLDDTVCPEESHREHHQGACPFTGRNYPVPTPKPTIKLPMGFDTLELRPQDVPPLPNDA